MGIGDIKLWNKIIILRNNTHQLSLIQLYMEIVTRLERFQNSFQPLIESKFDRKGTGILGHIVLMEYKFNR